MLNITNVQSNYSSAAPPGQVTNRANELGKEDFLYLLVTQLRNQDAMKPVDSYEFVAQLAQFSSLEQLQGMKKGMDTALNMQKNAFSLQAAQLIGKAVKVETNALEFRGKPVEIPYELAEDADVLVSVYDSKGELKKTIKAPHQSKGENRIQWDGKDDSGKMVDTASYRFEILALNQEKALVGAKGFKKSEVAGVKLDGNSVLLTLQGMDYPLSNLISIENQKNET